MLRKLILALLLTLPSMAMAIDLEGYYITVKGGASKTFNTGTLVSITDGLSLDVNYQYVNLGAFKGGTEVLVNGAFVGNFQRPINGGDIKTQELMVGLQYKF